MAMENNKKIRIAIMTVMICLLINGIALRQAFASTIYWGVFYTGCCSLSGLTSFEADAGKGAAIVNEFQTWGKTDGSQNFHTDWMDTFRNHGSIPMVTWQPQDASSNVTDAAYSLANIYNGNFDTYITKFATDAKAWGHPFFLRFAHEMNGTWYSWSEKENGNSPGDYIKAWRHVHDIFTQNGVTNATWVWGPNIDSKNQIQIDGLYPGSSYVDWVAMDGYNFGTVNGNTWKTFTQVFSATYTHITNLAPDKPLMIAETESEETGGDKAAWLTDAFGTQIPTNFPKVKAAVVFNKVVTYNWPIESSVAAQNAFASAISSSYYVSNQYSALNTSPIPLSDASSSTNPTSAPTTTPTPLPGTSVPTITPTPTIPITPFVEVTTASQELPNGTIPSIKNQQYTLYLPSSAQGKNILQTFLFNFTLGIDTILIGLKLMSFHI